MGTKPSVNTKVFAFLQFVGDYDMVRLVQVDHGPGVGTTILCEFCEMDVDDIIDRPDHHKKICEIKI